VIGVSRSPSPEMTKLCEHEDMQFEIFDMSNKEEIYSWVKSLINRFGRIYGLINNAAIGADGILGTMHEQEIAKTILVNLESPIVLTKYISRSMLISGVGRIINISSIIGSTGFSGMSVYAATKAGLIGFSKSLSRELGKGGVTVNCIAPGYMSTDMTQKISPEKLASIKRRSPSGKLATVESVASAVSFLLNENSAMINGIVLTVDAGSSA
jgi:3-oxoacyl-[acyl-carrier protein] reductase